MSDDWVDGIAPLELTSDAASYTVLLSCFINPNIGKDVAAITEIDVTTLYNAYNPLIFDPGKRIQDD